MSNNFTNDQIKELENNFQWMRDYYGQLKGAVIEDVSIAIYEDNKQVAFPSLKFKLVNGSVHECDVLSSFDLEMPGFIAGLPYKGD
jgi:hypothetical protein